MVRSRSQHGARLVLAASLVLAVVAVLLGLPGGGGETAQDVPFVPTPANVPEGREVEPFPDPLAWTPDREEEFVERAAAGSAHPLYARSPGGAPATAERTAVWRPLVEDAAEQAGIDADLVEGMVFLESAGRPDALTPAGLAGAAGIAQIVAETAQNLLGLKVDLEQSATATRRIRKALRRGDLKGARRQARRRRAVDERFDPAKAMQAAGRYLTLAKQRFGREDLAVVSYHMGMGNLEDVLDAYGESDVSYARVYFDSTPADHAEAQQRLAALGDDSANYLWKVYAARDIMRLHREDPRALERHAQLQTAKASAEEVLHPAGSTEVYATPEQLADAWEAGRIRALPHAPSVTGLRRDGNMGELARRVGAPRALYHGLRPEALALALYVGAQVRELGGGELTVTSTVRDQRYQQQLAAGNREATRGYSLHTTGWAFDVLRSYASRRQALMFQWVLDRLRVLNMIAWVREPLAIHITASQDAKALLPLLERIA